MSESPPTVQLFTDGSCLGNPGPGGWAFILVHPETQKILEGSGGDAKTTNNRMELMAVIQGLKTLSKSCKIELCADSQYVLLGLRDWMPKWKAKGWRRGKAPVKNVELWKALDEQLKRHEVNINWVRGHTGHHENERCDDLARAEATRFRDNPAATNDDPTGYDTDAKLFT